MVRPITLHVGVPPHQAQTGAALADHPAQQRDVGDLADGRHGLPVLGQAHRPAEDRLRDLVGQRDAAAQHAADPLRVLEAQQAGLRQRAHGDDDLREYATIGARQQAITEESEK
jgi:hypothetical protein